MKNQILAFFLFIVPFVSAQDRHSSSPYISGDTFRAYADFIIDETYLLFSTKQVTPGSTIFLNMNFAANFFKKIHPKIPCPYILITHNSDRAIPGPYVSILNDDKLIAWFGQNTEGYVHPKLHPIPIGIANRYWPHGNTSILETVIGLLEGIEKNHLLYMNFSIGTSFQERSFVYHLFVQQPYCFISPPKYFDSYLMDVAASKFVLSPRGNGLDSHRTWEALYMGAIPIVRTSAADAM